MYERLSKIDSLTCRDHHYLVDSDLCYYFGEYTARKGFDKSTTNQLIINFKKSVDRKGRVEYKYKLQAIDEIATLLNDHFVHTEKVTFIPVPPSKNRNDPLYDERIVSVLEKIKTLNDDVDYRDLIIQSETTEASHNSSNRLSPQEILKLYSFDELLVNNIRKHIFIFDDMLTTGSHFKAIQQLLLERFPEKKIYGIFVARRALEAVDWDFDADIFEA
ncbi:hypothetical protein BMR07_17035 [Methylococcaceae bacterium CS1]|nr:hypothetical protein BMR10_15020 [Methylococcaceae bacterium CS4]TXK94336.1 hypothetical protein BMR11_15375 [Methylococcaceae bacterium CS5]TXL02777.1 hypothetical protein BMR07_17035 [Methylococcaceae bacterium CS1]TXL03508.1 hypothetical protein BMR09_14780 [Methylococcaceae bacterium CS3]TXL06097.1 hypothetical protein BMR08_15655 [Methylococcaceae bacterium CS2]